MILELIHSLLHNLAVSLEMKMLVVAVVAVAVESILSSKHMLLALISLQVLQIHLHFQLLQQVLVKSLFRLMAFGNTLLIGVLFLVEHNYSSHHL